MTTRQPVSTKSVQSAKIALCWQRPSRRSWARKTWIKSGQFPCSWLPQRPSPTKGFLSWLGSHRWHGLSRHHSRKVPWNQVLVRRKGHDFGLNFIFFTWLQPDSSEISANDNEIARVNKGCPVSSKSPSLARAVNEVMSKGTNKTSFKFSLELGNSS